MRELPPPVLPCLCANLRRGSRALTHLYDSAFRPLGMRATQFTILQALAIVGEASQGQLAIILAIDSTTLTRTFSILKRRGWIIEGRSDTDRRERWLRLSPAGKAQLDRALPVWEDLQSRLRRRIGAPAWNQLLQLTRRIADITQSPGVSNEKL